MLRLVRTSSVDALASPARDPLLPLVDAVRGGSASALQTLLIEVGPSLLAAVRGVLGAHSAEVADVAQEAAVAFLEALGNFRSQCTTRHFASRIAVLRAIDARRRQSSRTRRESMEHDRGRDGPEHSSVEPYDRARLSALLRSLLADIPEAQAEVLVLHVILDYTIDEAAAATGAARETVRSRLRLAKAALRKRILGDPHLLELITAAR